MPIRYEDGISQTGEKGPLVKTVGAMLDNAVNTRFVYVAIMHIFACNND